MQDEEEDIRSRVASLMSESEENTDMTDKLNSDDDVDMDDVNEEDELGRLALFGRKRKQVIESRHKL